MKNHSFKAQILIFSSILLLFIVPPFFAPVLNESNTIFTQWNFPFQQIIHGIIAAVIFFGLKDPEKKVIFFRFPVILITGLLFCSALFMKFFYTLLSVESEENLVTIPQSFLQWLFCLLTFLPSAFYEEVIYRFYFTDALINLTSKKLNKKVWIIIFEISGCLVFALAHYYLGWLSVLNAAIGHVILRIAYKKNKSLWPGVIAHFLYNVISLILL